MKSKIKKHILLLTTIAAVVPCMVGWNPAAHYSIARQYGFSHVESGGFNLPDAWPTTSGFSISDLFCWSHSVKRTGVEMGVPKKPVYDENISTTSVNGITVYSFPENTREPGGVIKILKSKLETTNNNMTRTAKYFRGHNASDLPVHWSYFVGGYNPADFPEIWSLWAIHHRDKERWADYEILDYEQAVDYEESGAERIIYFWGADIDQNDTTYRAMSLVGVDSGIINKAQKVARKNRIDLDTGTSPLTFNDVQTVDAITNLVTGLENNITNNSIWGIKTMNGIEYSYFKDKLEERGWSKLALLRRYEEAKASFKYAMDNF